MLKAIIILCIILFFINCILLIPVKGRIQKRNKEPFYIDLYLLKKRLFSIRVYQNANNKSKEHVISFVDLCFIPNLNESLRNLKRDNFYVYLLLECARVNKVTIISGLSHSHPNLFPALGFTNWMVVSAVKRYIESTFQYIDNDYYQVMFDETNIGIQLEIELSATLFQIVLASLKNIKGLKQILSKKEKQV
ncbi:MAG: hypothetical protein NC090_00315 [Anaeroplasma bactoclasticum]|nr:hypothetical protein [Anaeroplasma bactoclasticum]